LIEKGGNPNVNEGAGEYGLVVSETAPSITVGFPPLCRWSFANVTRLRVKRALARK